MPAPTGPTNPELKKLISELREKGYKENIKFLISIAKQLEKPARIRAAVNVGKINRYAKKGETVIVPGKVLGCGDLTKKINVSAFKFSRRAREKIKSVGGSCLSIRELVKKNPKGRKVRIMV